MTKKRWSLRLRFLLVLIVLLVAVFASITFIIVRDNTTTLRSNLVNQSKSFAALATQQIGGAFVVYQDSGTLRIGQEISSFTNLDHDIDQVEIVNTNGNQLFTTNTSAPIAVNSNAASGLAPTYLYDKSGNLTGIVEPYLEAFGIHRYAVVYGISYQRVNQSIQAIVTSIIALSAAILLLSLVVWYFLINRLFLQPVGTISQMALLISKGGLERKIHLERNDEIGDLAVAVDTMADSLQADIAKLKEVDKLKSEFMMITSHNLRTPLTIIRGYLDLLKEQPSLPASMNSQLQLIAINVTRLEGIAENALTVSTMESGQKIVMRKPIQIAPILQQIASDFGTLAVQKKLKFKATVTTSAWVNLSTTYFSSALWHLLDNAYKFTAEGGTIGLSAVNSEHGDRIEITVTDSGIGITAEEIPKLFTKFHRGTDTLKYDYEGTGIGLYIAKLIAEQHDGSITVQSVEGQGSAFTLWLPTIPPPTPDPPK